jgi:lysine 6-dehydrogenase
VTMRFLVLGAGAMGRAVALDLARSEGVGELVLADSDAGRLGEAVVFVGSPLVRALGLDVLDRGAVVKAMRGSDVAISCVPYRFNLDLAKAAVEAGCSFCDLGGNTAIVRKELVLDPQARTAGVTVIPDCGLAPGMATVLAADALGRLDRVEELHIRVGGLPVDPQPPLDYMVLFSPAGLVNEYKERAVVIRDGRVQTVESLEDVEEVVFPEPLGRLEAFNTSGGTSTLPQTMLGKVRNLDYKTVRYPGHCERMRLLRDLGLFEEGPVRLGEVEVAPRAVLEALLRERLPHEGDDVVLLRVSASGSKDREERTLTYTMVERCDREAGLTAMQRTTAFPASIVAQMLASGEISERGAIPQELAVPPERFIEELQRHGVEVEIAWD